MKSFSSLFCCLVLALSAAGCWVPELPDSTLFSCDKAEDCAAEGVVCAPRTGQRGYCCTPTAEVCNGADDNCNGQPDDLADASCYTGPEGTLDQGNCKAGKAACGANGTVVCAGEVLPAATESCNGDDDDCDGETDEGFNLQTDMANCGACGKFCNAVTQLCVDGTCKMRGEKVCDDGLDDDSDGAKDCADSDCDNQTRACNSSDAAKNCICIGRTIGEGNCGDGLDNDSDGFIDCVEQECTDKSCGSGCVCTTYVKRETACGDGADNDGDTKADCADSDCANLSCGTGCLCQGGKAVETVCSDGVNNDKTEGTDCADSDCHGKECSAAGGCTCTTSGSKLESTCNDNLDNDGNGTIDCVSGNADANCVNGTCGTGCSFVNCAKVETACTDLLDNDGDTRIDCADTDCNGKSCGTNCICAAGVKKENSCTDRADNDGDAQIDCADRVDCPAGVACTRTNGNPGTCQGNGSCN